MYATLNLNTMKPLLVIILAAQLLTGLLAARQHWQLVETRRLLDTANAQIQHAIATRHAGHVAQMPSSKLKVQSSKP